MERAVPVLPVDDLTAARTFYVDGLGFEVCFEATEDGKSGGRTFDVTDPFGNTIFVVGPLV